MARPKTARGLSGERADFLREWVANSSWAKVARACGVSSTTIRRACGGVGISPEMIRKINEELDNKKGDESPVEIPDPHDPENEMIEVETCGHIMSDRGRCEEPKGHEGLHGYVIVGQPSSQLHAIRRLERLVDQLTEAALYWRAKLMVARAIAGYETIAGVNLEKIAEQRDTFGLNVDDEPPAKEIVAWAVKSVRERLI